MAGSPCTSCAQRSGKNAVIVLLLSLRLPFVASQDACTTSDSVTVVDPMNGAFGDGTIAMVGGDGTLMVNLGNDTYPDFWSVSAYRVFSKVASNCPTTYETNACPVGTAADRIVTTQPETMPQQPMPGPMPAPPTVSSNDGTTITLTYDDQSTEDAPIAEVVRVDDDAPCIDHCRCAVAGSGGDPFTHFNGRRTQYWPPVGVPVKLLEVGGVKLSGTCFGNDAGNLWFHDFVLSADNKDIIRMSAADPTPLITREAVAGDSQAPATLDLSFLSAGVWQHKTLEGQYAAADGNISVTYKHWAKELGAGHQQAVEIRSQEMKVTIFSAKANKFHDQVKQLSFLHLDMKIDQIDYNKVAGVLPEIWGLRPLTAEVKKMLQKPVDPVIV